jgi:hypothetical protein
MMTFLRLRHIYEQSRAMRSLFRIFHVKTVVRVAEDGFSWPCLKKLKYYRKKTNIERGGRVKIQFKLLLEAVLLLITTLWSRSMDAWLFNWARWHNVQRAIANEQISLSWLERTRWKSGKSVVDTHTVLLLDFLTCNDWNLTKLVSAKASTLLQHAIIQYSLSCGSILRHVTSWPPRHMGAFHSRPVVCSS